MTPKILYQGFCEKEKDIPIFSQPWYLDAVCGEDGWNILLVKRGNEVAVSMPIQDYKKYGFRMPRMPLHVKYWGPYFSKKFRSEKQQQKLMGELISQLPAFDYFEQYFHPSIINGLPFHWEKFDVSVRYTFRIDLDQDLQKIYNGISSNYRNNKIAKAQQLVKIIERPSVEDFFEVQKKTFLRQQIGSPFSLDFFKRYDTILSKQQARKMFFAIDKNDQIHAAVYLIWDEHTVYLHLAGNDPELSKSGAGILLIWHSIQFAKNVLRKKVFDFEGSMIEPITKVRKEFGAIQTPYLKISKYNSKLLLILDGLRGQF